MFDICHASRRPQHRIRTLRPHRHAYTVLPPRIDTRRDAKSVVGEDLHDATVDEYAEAQWLPIFQDDRTGFRRRVTARQGASKSMKSPR